MVSLNASVRAKIMAKQHLRKPLQTAAPIFFVIWFSWFFLFHALPNWETTYHRFHVPAAKYPGGDARNIQFAAYCLKHELNPWRPQTCTQSKSVAEVLSAKTNVPAYNYPIWWAKAYAMLLGDDEPSFILFWRLNGLALICAIYLLSRRHSILALAILLLNPVTLLTIERGNIDAWTFAIAMVPWIFNWKQRQGCVAFFLSLAGALKIYPMIGLLALGFGRWHDTKPASWLAALALGPLIYISMGGLSHYINGTPCGYPYSYGLMAGSLAPGMAAAGMNNMWFAGLATALLMAGAVACYGRPSWRASARLGIKVNEPDASLILVCLVIYLGTFFAFTNWAYRLIFLYPAVLACWRAKVWPLRAFSIACVALLWSPWLRHGWEIQTFFAYLVAAYALALTPVVVQAQGLDKRLVGAAWQRLTGAKTAS